VKFWWFPDNTVLCSFAAVRRLDILEKTLADRGRWTEAVAHEANQSAQVLPGLSPVLHDGWLGDPIEIDEIHEVRAVDVIRRTVFGGQTAEPRKHLGEAQTLYLLQNRTEFRSSVWITDDREAYTYAKRQGILTKDTVGVMRHAVADGVVTAEEGLRLLHGMMAADRFLLSMPHRPDDLRT
jgi:predicted nucleic acid-binding protein